MTTYRTIASTETDADSPVTVQLMTALADNPTAIAEGASGAPRVDGRALDVVLNNSVVNIPQADAGGTTVLITNTDLTNISYVMITGFADLGGSFGSGNTTAFNMNYQTTTDGGSNWTGSTTFLATGSYDSQIYENFSLVVDVSGSINGVRVRGVNGVKFVSSDIHISIVALGGS